MIIFTILSVIMINVCGIGVYGLISSINKTSNNDKLEEIKELGYLALVGMSEFLVLENFIPDDANALTIAITYIINLLLQIISFIFFIAMKSNKK